MCIRDRLTGANHAYEASSFFEPTGNAPGIGQTFILLDPKPLNPDFSARLEALCGHLLGQEGVRLPGERRFALRERNRISGVNRPEALYNLSLIHIFVYLTVLYKT